MPRLIKLLREGESEGEIARGKELGYSDNSLRIWMKCKQCGRLRWVNLIFGKPQYEICMSCSSVVKGGIRKPPVYQEETIQVIVPIEPESETSISELLEPMSQFASIILDSYVDIKNKVVEAETRLAESRKEVLRLRQANNTLIGEVRKYSQNFQEKLKAAAVVHSGS